MLYVIAELYKNERLYEYRVLDSDTEEVKEYNYSILSQHILDNSLKIENIDMCDGQIVLKWNANSVYTKIGLASGIHNRNTIIVLERISFMEYKCTDYTGEIALKTISNIVNEGGNVVIINGDLTERGEIIMAKTYKIDEERVRYLENKIKSYRAKTAMLGDIPLDIEVIGHDAIIVSADKNIEHCIIPSFVTGIRDRAFSMCSRIESLYIPENIRFIGDEAFSKCQGLIDVTMLDSDIKVGEGAFYYCDKLRSIRLSNKLKYISKSMFSECMSLQRIEIPESVKVIYEDAFDFCSGLREVKFNGPIDNINDYAFYNCGRLEVVELPHVTNIGVGVFADCNELQEVTLHSLDIISNSMFRGCNSLKKVVVLGGITEIENEAFENCELLDTVILPNTIKIIYERAFINVADNLEITIPKGTELDVSEIQVKIKYV